MTYTRTYTIAPAATSGAIRWKSNSVQPDIGVSSNLMASLDSFGRQYTFYRPRRYHGTLACINTSPFPTTLYLVQQISDPGTAITGYAVRSGNRWGKTCLLAPSPITSSTHTFRFNNRHVDIVGSVAPETDNTYVGILSAALGITDPVDLNYIGLGYESTAAVTLTIQLCLLMELELFDPVAMST